MNYTEFFQVKVFNQQSKLSNGSICPCFEVILETIDLNEAISLKQSEYTKLNPTNQKRTFADIPSPKITSYLLYF